MSIISSSDVLIDAVLQTTEDPKSQILIRDEMGRGVEEVPCNTLEQRLVTSNEEWEVEEAEPLRTQQHLITEKERDVFLGKTKSDQIGEITWCRLPRP